MTSPQAEGQDPFGRALERAREGMGRLAELLEEEARAIESRDLEALGRRLGDKQALLTEIEGLIGELKRHLEAAGLGFNPEGMARFIQLNDPEGQWGERWSDLLAETRRCERLNRETARLIEREQRRVSLALSLLLGEEAGATAYDPRGRPVASGQRGRSLSQA